jgi:hypothetical protein
MATSKHNPLLKHTARDAGHAASIVDAFSKTNDETDATNKDTNAATQKHFIFSRSTGID